MQKQSDHFQEHEQKRQKSKEGGEMGTGSKSYNMTICCDLDYVPELPGRGNAAKRENILETSLTYNDYKSVAHFEYFC